MTPPAAHLLLVEDDPLLRRNLRKGLAEQGYEVAVAGDIKTARNLLAGSMIHLAVLDLGLPDGTGYDLLEELRNQGSRIPVIILTARDKIEDKIKGLDIGADDYLIKPFDFNELAARIRAHLRRSGDQTGTTLIVSDLVIDLVGRTVRRGDHVIECTPREFDVLVYLAKSAGQPVSRQALTTEVWKVRSRMTSMDNVIDVMMSRLRDKVDGDHPDKLIHTVRGLGFMIKAPT